MGFEPVAHRAARIEDALVAQLGSIFSNRGWRKRVVPYTCYGSPGWVRVFGRVLLSRPDQKPAKTHDVIRGWRSFFNTVVAHQEVTIHIGAAKHCLRTDRSGYLDQVVDSDLTPGWHQISLEIPGFKVSTNVFIVDPDAQYGLISDIDDTVLVTSLPRPMLAAWNTLVLHEHARTPVPGMAVLYERLVNQFENFPVFYLSTGAWNTAPALNRFIDRHLYPRGPLLLTDWGPTTDSWFRNGPAHKRSQLRRLVQEFPQIKWILIGDDGQHDPDIYAEFAMRYPKHVAAIAIRNLSPIEQALASGSPVAAPSWPRNRVAPWVSGPTGGTIARKFSRVGILTQARPISQANAAPLENQLENSLENQLENPLENPDALAEADAQPDSKIAKSAGEEVDAPTKTDEKVR